MELYKYKGLFRDFIYDDEWKDIIVEVDFYFEFFLIFVEGLGLRNIYFFGFVNVLYRFIIFFDSVIGM